MNTITLLQALLTLSQTAVTTLQSCVTCLAVIIGGLWTYNLFIKKREKYPHASLSHQLLQQPLDDAHVLLHAVVTLKNEGEVLIKVGSAELRLLQVLPLDEGYAQSLQDGKDLVPEQENEVQWYLIGLRKLIQPGVPYEIEPGEIQTFHADYVIDAEIKTIQLYSFFQNLAKIHQNLGWDCLTMHEVNPTAMQGKE